MDHQDFDKHWQAHISPTVSKPKLRQAEVFFAPILDYLRNQSLKILDVGCGDGVNRSFLQSLQNPHLAYTGVDYSALAIGYLARKYSESEDLFIQMDATELAVSDDIFDVVFAYGVIAYTINPRRSFAELCRVCKPGGWVGVWLFPKKAGLSGLAFDGTRRFCRWVGPFWTRRIADLIVPGLGYLPTQSRVSLRNSTWQQCREVVLVNIAPKRLAFFRIEDIENLFKFNNVEIEYSDLNNPILIWGRKR